MNILNRKNILTFIFYSWIIILAILTSMSFSTSIEHQNEKGIRLDYFEHFFMYAMIPVLYFFSDGAYLLRVFRNSHYLILSGILFCILTEIQQLYIPGRSFNPVDLGLNLTGFIFGIFACKYLNNRSKK